MITPRCTCARCLLTDTYGVNRGRSKCTYYTSSHTKYFSKSLSTRQKHFRIRTRYSAKTIQLVWRGRVSFPTDIFSSGMDLCLLSHLPGSLHIIRVCSRESQEARFECIYYIPICAIWGRWCFLPSSFAPVVFRLGKNSHFLNSTRHFPGDARGKWKMYEFGSRRSSSSLLGQSEQMNSFGWCHPDEWSHLVSTFIIHGELTAIPTRHEGSKTMA